MKFIHTLICTLIPAAGICAPASDHEASVLSTGRWVEVTTEGRGITKITHDRLRSMGFTSPESVTVYGRDGAQLPVPFIDNDGNDLQPDDLTAIGSIHIGDALYFYVSGTDSYRFEADADSPTGGIFRRTGKNIYTDNSVFLLTDSHPGCQIGDMTHSGESGYENESIGVGLLYHEEDLAQNDNNNGQLFWGEEFPADGSRLLWDYELPGSAGRPAEMRYSLHIESEIKTGPDGTYTFGVSPLATADGDCEEVSISRNPIRNKTSYHAPQATQPFQFSMPADEGTVFASFERGAIECNVANLDWWAITAKFDINARLVSGESQFEFAIPSQGRQGVSLPAAEVYEAWDITDALHPVRLSASAGTETLEIGFDGGDSKTVAMFNPGALLPGISGWREIANQDLHAFASEGADLAIICLPRFRDKALEIAAIHEGMGQVCAVATTEETYREFSGGMPDPMAYRNFVKMLYDAPRSVRNLLLLGTITSDARGLRASEGREERIIAYQKNLSSKHDGAMSDVDLYGVMDTKITEATGLESMDVAVGVGILPVSSDWEASVYIEKLKKYISGEGMELHLADHLLIGCDGDNHQHENQCEGVRSQLDEYNDGFRHIPVYDDQIGVERSRRAIIENINSGVGLATYIGHGGCLELTKQDGLFAYRDLRHLRNHTTPMMFFAACNITNGDMGQRGMSEHMVVGSQFGLIGAVTSNRTAMSSSNYELVKTFYSELTPQPDALTGSLVPSTVGEAYARTKTAVKSANELTFQLMCDPAIVIPLPTYRLTDPELNAMVGEISRLSGYVTDTSGDILKNYNGKVSAKIVVPGTISPITGVLTGTEGSSVKGEDQVIAVGTGKVTDGRYEISIAPGQISGIHAGRDLKVLLGAYDPHLKMGAASAFDCTLDKNEDVSSSQDVSAPSVEDIEYDDRLGALVITSADDTALDLSTEGMLCGYAVKLDGKPLGSHLLRNVEFIPDASLCRHTVYLSALGEGIHTVTVKLTDIAGNTSTHESSFSVGNRSTSLQLSADCRHTEGKIDFTADTDGDLADLVVIVVDSEGREAYSAPFDGKTICVPSHVLPSGVAKAWCEDKARGIRSRTVTLPIIKPASLR